MSLFHYYLLVAFPWTIAAGIALAFVWSGARKDEQPEDDLIAVWRRNAENDND